MSEPSEVTRWRSLRPTFVTNYDVIEDLHQAIMHALAQYIRQSWIRASDFRDCVLKHGSRWKPGCASRASQYPQNGADRYQCAWRSTF